MHSTQREAPYRISSPSALPHGSTTITFRWLASTRSFRRSSRSYCTMIADRIRRQAVSSVVSSREPKKFALMTPSIIPTLASPTDRDGPDYKSKLARIHKRVDKLVACDTWSKPDCKRLPKRPIKFRESVFTFLDDPAVPFDNNRPSGRFVRR